MPRYLEISQVFDAVGTAVGLGGSTTRQRSLGFGTSMVSFSGLLVESSSDAILFNTAPKSFQFLRTWYRSRPLLLDPSCPPTVGLCKKKSVHSVSCRF
jgi:hypothetical protein